MVLVGHPVDHRLDGGVQQLDDEHEQDAADEQSLLDAALAQPQAKAVR